MMPRAVPRTRDQRETAGRKPRAPSPPGPWRFLACLRHLVRFAWLSEKRLAVGRLGQLLPRALFLPSSLSLQLLPGSHPSRSSFSQSPVEGKAPI